MLVLQKKWCMKSFERSPKQTVEGQHKKIFIFSEKEEIDSNIDKKTVHSFGEEWEKFHHFSEELIQQAGEQYFDIVPESVLKDAYMIDIGCGSGRWTKYLHDKVAFIEAVDPSNAIFYADRLLANVGNVRLSKASVESLPFADESFDFGMAVGVLHHIPDTAEALRACVQKIKKGGYFYVYIYYNLDNRGWAYKSIFKVVNVVRRFISGLPPKPKKVLCDAIAILIYMPMILLVRLLKLLGFNQLADKLPLSYYADKDFYMVRNDALDRFGTPLEHRFSKTEIQQMMENVGLSDIVFSEQMPYYHAIGKRV